MIISNICRTEAKSTKRGSHGARLGSFRAKREQSASKSKASEVGKSGKPSNLRYENLLD